MHLFASGFPPIRYRNTFELQLIFIHKHYVDPLMDDFKDLFQTILHHFSQPIFARRACLTLSSLPTGPVYFANSLDPDQARLYVGPDLDPNCLTLPWYS